MGGYIETAIGRASAGHDVEIGRKAASQALRQLHNFQPSLTLLFVSSELDIAKVARGAADMAGDCPIIGASSAGEIAHGYFSHSAVAAVIASAHLTVHADLGDNVGSDY